MAFDDGTPLDASKLQALETELLNVKASIPKVGSSSTNVNVNQTVVSQKQILGGITSSVPLVPGQEVQVNLPYTTLSTPTAVIMSPVKSSGTLKGNVSWYVQNPVGTNGATAKVYLDDGAKAFSITFYFMVICG